MRVRLKGINSKRKTLADGTVKTYYWLGKAGPRIEGEPGTLEFMASYNEAAARVRKPRQGVIHSVLHGFQNSDDFLSREPRTRADYVKKIKLIEAEFGDFPLTALADRRTRGEFMAWRDKLALRSRRQADYAWQVLARVLSWAMDRGIVAVNPCAKGGRLYRGSRADRVWTRDDEKVFLSSAPSHLHLALLLGLWTGQRQGDLLALTWMQYDGKYIRLKQSKTGMRVVIPVGAPLKVALEVVKPEQASGPILRNSDGAPWTSDGFRSSWRKACAAAGIVGVTFNDLRGTAVTRLALAEASGPEIATITGHSLRDVRSILDAHYLHRDPALAESGIRKLERGTKVPDRAPDCA